MDSAVKEFRIKQWLPIFEQQAKSGLNKKDWCKQNGIKRHTFFKWQRECRAYLLSSKQEVIPTTNEPAFVEISCSQEKTDIAAVSASPSSSASDSSSLVISCNGFSVSVNGQVDEANLTKILRVIAYVH